jgi:hypothetical protein
MYIRPLGLILYLQLASSPNFLIHIAVPNLPDLSVFPTIYAVQSKHTPTVLASSLFLSVLLIRNVIIGYNRTTKSTCIGLL